MPAPNEPLRLTNADLNSPQVQQYLDVQASMRRVNNKSDQNNYP